LEPLYDFDSLHVWPQPLGRDDRKREEQREKKEEMTKPHSLDLRHKVISSGRKVQRQPGLMKVRKMLIGENCLSSDGVPITFTYFLNPPYLSLKCPVQFVPIDNPQNCMHGLKTLAFVIYLSPFEFFFHCRKQIEVIGG
jgi:hypothetical protein